METGQNIIIKDILTEAIKAGASDIHFSVGNYPVLRVNQELRYLEDRDLINSEFMEKLADSLLDAKQKEALSLNKEVIISHSFDKLLRFKINIFYQRGFLSVTLRHIPTQIPTLDSLGLGELKKLTEFKRGLVIVSGSFGSGRSTTVAAMLDEINRTRKEYILTIEDPIEYIFNNNLSIIEQREVGRDTNSFADALQYFQEEDGDVLFLEQLADPKIIPAVLEIASGSSLVLTAVAASSAAKTVSGILNNFTTFDEERVRDMLANALKAVVCQKMIPKIGGGVKVVCEVLIVNDKVKSTIAGGNISQLDNIIQTSRREGMLSFTQSLLTAYRNQEISLEEALAQAPDRAALENLINQ